MVVSPLDPKCRFDPPEQRIGPGAVMPGDPYKPDIGPTLPARVTTSDPGKADTSTAVNAERRWWRSKKLR